jgi:hypothetical protein
MIKQKFFENLRFGLLQHGLLVVAGVILILYFLPFIIQGENSNILIHDNLDSAFNYYVIMADEGKTLSLNPNATIERVMGGLPKMLFPSGRNFLAILCLLFIPITAYLINFIVVHSVAFAGMYLLLQKHFIKEQSFRYISILASLCFAFVPFYTVFGLSVAGIPLLLYAFLNLEKGTYSFRDYLIIGLFPLFSSLLFSGVFILFCLFIWVIVSWVKEKKPSRPMVIGTLILSGVFLLVETDLIYAFLFNREFISHRSEIIFEKVDFTTLIDRAEYFFYNSQYHISSSPAFIFTVLAFGIIVGLARQHKDTAPIVWLFLANVLIAFIYGFYSWELLDGFREKFPLSQSFQWNRFTSLTPLIWYIQFALALKIIANASTGFGFAKPFIVFMIVYQFYFVWKANVEYRETVYNLSSGKQEGWSFGHFYDRVVFKQIEDFIGKPKNSYHVGAVGLHPSIAQHFGFYTIDGYQANYPLEYKHTFRKLIAPELAKNPALQKYFDEWGSRCYLFCSELVYNFEAEKTKNIQVNTLEYDFSHGPSVDYIFSAVNLAQSPGMEFVRSFETENSKWKIFLYKVGK